MKMQLSMALICAIVCVAAKTNTNSFEDYWAHWDPYYGSSGDAYLMSASTIQRIERLPDGEKLRIDSPDAGASLVLLREHRDLENQVPVAATNSIAYLVMAKSNLVYRINCPLFVQAPRMVRWLDNESW